MNKLTCIIPFLNEGIEIFRTVKSIRDTVGNSVDIILVNDSSDDGIDYKVIANQFNCQYVINNSRRGVAGSRDLGVQLANTDMCLLLDGHMGFYDSKWLDEITNTIELNPRRIYCTACHPNWYPYDSEEARKNKGIHTGAYLDTGFKDWHSSFEPRWLSVKLKTVEEIPIVLGATYCFSKEYYIEIGGLSGLVTYGGDEAWLSLKSWAIGEGCAVIGNTSIGHLFRDRRDVPYVASMSDHIFNRLLIVSVICPDKKHWITELIRQGGPEVVKLLKDNWDEIVKTRTWFTSVEQEGWRDRFNELNNEFLLDGEDI